MLPKSKRLPAYLISSVLEKGGKHQNELVSLFVLPSEEKTTQIAVLVPTRLSKKAVKRNRTKNLLAQSVAQNYKSIRSGFWIILMAKKILDKEKLQEVEPTIKRLLKKSRINKNEITK